MEQIEKAKALLITRNPNDPAFLQAVEEVLESLELVEETPELLKDSLLERLIEPERQILFRVPWVDDQGNVQVNRGFRVDFNLLSAPIKAVYAFIHR